MIRKLSDMGEFPVKNLCEGEGTAVFTSLFERGTLPRIFSKVTLEPGASCGEHVHDTDGEIYMVLEGEVTFIEDGVEYTCYPGECEYCTDGHSHGAINRSDKPCSYLAVMIK